jgi:glycosyltransferase involved in cell wall biosynthesis
VRILLMTSLSPFDELTGPVAAGAEMAMRRIAEALASRGHQVHYLAMDDGPERIVELNGVSVHLISRERSRKARRSVLSRLVVGPIDSWMARGRKGGRNRFRRIAIRESHARWGLKDRLYELIGKHGIELIHAYSSIPDSLVAAIAATELRIPVVLRMGGRFWYLRYERLKPKRRDAYLEQLRYVFGAVDCLAYNSTVLKQQSADLFRELKIRPVEEQVVLDIGVQAPIVDAGAADPLVDVQTAGRFLVSCVGKFKEGSKRQDLIVRAVKLLGDEIPLKVVFAGAGPTREQIEQLARTEGILDRIAFLGNIPYGSVFRLFEKSDFVVHPTEFEGSSKAIAEAMLCGKVVIASDIPAIREHLEDGVTGVLAENTAESFAARIREVAGRASDRERIGANARDYAVRVFDPDRNVALYEELFRSLVNRLA